MRAEEHLKFAEQLRQQLLSADESAIAQDNGPRLVGVARHRKQRATQTSAWYSVQNSRKK